MKIKVIKSEKDYSVALQQLEKVFDAKPNTTEGDEAEILTLLIEDYEKKHYPIEAPDPVEAILFRMEQMNLKQVDLIPLIGSKERVSEILNRKRRLTLDMIAALHDQLGIAYESLISKSVKKKSNSLLKPSYKKLRFKERPSVVQEPGAKYRKR